MPFFSLLLPPLSPLPTGGRGGFRRCRIPPREPRVAFAIPTSSGMDSPGAGGSGAGGSLSSLLLPPLSPLPTAGRGGFRRCRTPPGTHGLLLLSPLPPTRMAPAWRVPPREAPARRAQTWARAGPSLGLWSRRGARGAGVARPRGCAPGSPRGAHGAGTPPGRRTPVTEVNKHSSSSSSSNTAMVMPPPPPSLQLHHLQGALADYK